MRLTAIKVVGQPSVLYLLPDPVALEVPLVEAALRQLCGYLVVGVGPLLSHRLIKCPRRRRRRPGRDHLLVPRPPYCCRRGDVHVGRYPDRPPVKQWSSTCRSAGQTRSRQHRRRAPRSGGACAAVARHERTSGGLRRSSRPESIFRQGKRRCDSRRRRGRRQSIYPMSRLAISPFVRLGTERAPDGIDGGGQLRLPALALGFLPAPGLRVIPLPPPAPLPCPVVPVAPEWPRPPVSLPELASLELAPLSWRRRSWRRPSWRCPSWRRWSWRRRSWRRRSWRRGSWRRRSSRRWSWCRHPDRSGLRSAWPRLMVRMRRWYRPGLWV